MSKPNAPDGPNLVTHSSSKVNWSVFHLEQEQTKARLAALIDAAAEEFHVSILGYALMSNHFHLVAQSPGPEEFARLTSRRTPSRHRVPWPRGHQNASVRAQFMRYVRTTMSRERHRELGTAGRFWDGQYDARSVDSALSLAVRIAYDHLNPVKPGMVTAPEDYRWSSANEWVTGARGSIRLSLDSLPFGADREELRKAVLHYQRTVAFSDVPDLGDLVRKTHDSTDAIRRALEEAGLPIFECGATPAN